MEDHVSNTEKYNAKARPYIYSVRIGSWVHVRAGRHTYEQKHFYIGGKY